MKRLSLGCRAKNSLSPVLYFLCLEQRLSRSYVRVSGTRGPEAGGLLPFQVQKV